MDSKEIQPNLKNKLKIKKPTRYKIIFHNDDFTPFFFVEKVLTIIFNKTEEESAQIAYTIHSTGSAVVGVYPQEIAQAKHAQTVMNAEQNGFPLHCEVEPEETEE